MDFNYAGGQMYIYPRGFLGTWMHFALYGSIYFAMAWILLSIVEGGQIFLHEALGQGLLGSACFGILFGFMMAFPFRLIRCELSIDEKDKKLSYLYIVMAEIGYHPESSYPLCITFRPSIYVGLLVGRISLHFEGDRIILLGPAMHVNKIAKMTSSVVSCLKGNLVGW